jgi:hypothetical protein
MEQQFDYAFAARMGRLELSPFYTVQSTAADIECNDRGVLYLSIVEPDFDAPRRSMNVAVKAIRHGHTKYTGSDGTKQSKKAIQLKFYSGSGLSYAENEITATMGDVQAIFNTLTAIVSAGDEVAGFDLRPSLPRRRIGSQENFCSPLCTLRSFFWRRRLSQSKRNPAR